MTFEMDKESRRILERFEAAASLSASWRKEVNVLNRAYNNDQWDAEERKYLTEHKRHAVTVNIFAPAIDGLVALLAANAPRYKAIPSVPRRTNIYARAADFALEYVAYASQFSHEFIYTMKDYGIGGIGWMMADVDPVLDCGYGEVVTRYVPLRHVYWDWRAKMPGYRDMQWLIIVNWPSVSWLKAVFPKHNAVIEEGAKMNFAIDTWLERENSDSQKLFLAGDVWRMDEMFTGDDKIVPVLEHYEQIYVNVWVVSDPAKGYDEYFDEEEFEKEIKGMLPPEVANRAYKIMMPRVRKTVSLGGWRVLDERIMPITNIPAVPFVRIGTGSSLPQGIGSRILDLNVDFNRRRMAIIENAMSSSTGRILTPRGIIDDDEWDAKSRLPGAKIGYKQSAETKDAGIIQLQSQQLPNQFYLLENTQVELLEYVSGVDALFLGSGRQVADTYRQSLMIEDYGKRRIKAIDMSSIDAGLNKLGQTVLELCQWWYDFDKTLAVMDDDGRMREFALTRSEVNPETGEPRANLDDFRNIKFNVRVITGSTMPTNKYAMLEMYMELLDRGFPVERQVIECTDIAEVDETIMRMDQIEQAKGMIQELQDAVKNQQDMIQQLQNRLITADMRDQSRTLMLAEHLASQQRQMQERLGKALVEMSSRMAAKDITRSAAITEAVGRSKIQNLLERMKDREQARKQTE